MYVSVVFTILFALFSQFAQAKELNGNLDYELRTEGQNILLTLSNKRPETLVTLRALALLLPTKSQTPQTQLIVPLEKSIDISPAATLIIGKVSELAHLIAPERDGTIYQSIFVSEGDNCNCDSIGFMLKLNVDYPGGISQENLGVAFLNFIVR